jgi:TIR domain
MTKYHVALSFAGEDRKYVEKVAKHLQAKGVKVFYDKFEETKLWGKDLYTYFSDVYQNQAFFTVMFISGAYKEKLWTNHERKSAQARAFSENKEYILPAFFDTSVEVPGVLKTTGHMDLSKLTPERFADKIVEKLQDSGVMLVTKIHFFYSDAACADIDFPIKAHGDEVSELLTALRSYNWYTQSPAIKKIFLLDWSKRTPDEAFVLGRNIYQCAVGGEREAEAIMKDLRRHFARLPAEWAEHVLNGMFYEAYFDHEGKFRGSKLKNKFLSELFATETVAKYERSIAYVQYVLDPYRGSLGILPSKTPEILKVSVKIDAKDPPVLTSVKCQGKEQLITVDENADDPGWRFSFRGFTLEAFPELLTEFWNIPKGHLEVKYDQDLPATTKVHLTKGKSLGTLKV